MINALHRFTVVLGAVALLLTTGCPQTVPSKNSIVFVNQTPMSELTVINVVPSSSSTWGENLLMGGAGIPFTDRFSLTNVRNGVYDFRIIQEVTGAATEEGAAPTVVPIIHSEFEVRIEIDLRTLDSTHIFGVRAFGGIIPISAADANY